MDKEFRPLFFIQAAYWWKKYSFQMQYGKKWKNEIFRWMHLSEKNAKALQSKFNYYTICSIFIIILITNKCIIIKILFLNFNFKSSHSTASYICMYTHMYVYPWYISHVSCHLHVYKHRLRSVLFNKAILVMGSYPCRCNGSRPTIIY